MREKLTQPPEFSGRKPTKITGGAFYEAEKADQKEFEYYGSYNIGRLSYHVATNGNLDSIQWRSLIGDSLTAESVSIFYDNKYRASIVENDKGGKDLVITPKDSE